MQTSLKTDLAFLSCQYSFKVLMIIGKSISGPFTVMLYASCKTTHQPSQVQYSQIWGKPAPTSAP